MPATQSASQPKRLLLVEDNEDALEVYAASLRHAGFEVIEATTLEEAKSAVLQRRPDLVVLDCRLPDGDGLVVLERWRQKGSAMAEVPVIVLTASGQRQDVDAALLAGADQFVPKPCSGPELALHAKRAMDGTRPSARLRRAVV